MAEPIASMPDIAELLMREFEAVIAVSTVTEVVLRLSRGAALDSATLADLAREELRELAAATAASPSDAVGAAA